MDLKKVDLYEACAKDRPDGATGYLQCYIQRTPFEMQVLRARPAVVILPGGGYGSLAEREGEPVAFPFMKAGYQAFVLTYSYAPVRFPASLREVAMAIRYIRENAKELEVDPEKIAVIGFSAGGHLCGTIGTMYDAPELADIGTPQQLRPNAIGLCYPVTVAYEPTHMESFYNLCGEDNALIHRLSMDQLVRKDMPPTFLWHCRDDGCVPVRGSLILARRLDEVGADFAAHFYRRTGHGISTCDTQVYTPSRLPEFSNDTRRWMDSMIDFFTEVGLTVGDVPR